ncbi:zinc finger protein 142-like [Hylaeus volcanicus]|uniref:zinc finger protein 142-like n=1 Tax=Hylaeus volcanicus TaxID=313075 RepID=UPI0023B7896C|nr:zinc finger protein 142-like [Hylaeus volcanicus]
MEPLYPCPYCTHRARIPTLLKYHVKKEKLSCPNKHAPLLRMDQISVRFVRISLSVRKVQLKPILFCPNCGKGPFTWKTNLRRHLSTSCGRSPKFHCDICVFKTSRKDILLRHMRNMHPPALHELA